MKLKKVISLLLGGVMALSMLTACGADADSDTGSVAAAVANTATSNTEVVSYVVEYLEAVNTKLTGTNVSLNTSLTGNEANDLTTAVKYLKEGVVAQYTAKQALSVTVDGIENITYRSNANPYVLLVEKTDTESNQTLGYAIGVSILNTSYINAEVKYVSVFDAEIDQNVALVGNVGGTDVSKTDTDEYWVIVVTRA